MKSIGSADHVSLCVRAYPLTTSNTLTTSSSPARCKAQMFMSHAESPAALVNASSVQWPHLDLIPRSSSKLLGLWSNSVRAGENRRQFGRNCRSHQHRLNAHWRGRGTNSKSVSTGFLLQIGDNTEYNPGSTNAYAHQDGRW